VHGDDGGVVIGALGHPARASVDAFGRVTPQRSPWSLDWSVHVGGRWLRPGRDTTVRQRLLGHAPVVVSTTRDVSLTAYGAPGPIVVVEIANHAAVPVAVAVDVTPRAAADVVWDGGRTVRVDGRVAVRFARAAAEHDPDLGFVFPLPHRASVLAILGLDGNGVADQRPPTAEQTVRGWDILVARGLAVDVPDARLTEAVEVARRRVLLATDAAPPAPVVATAARWGLAPGDASGPAAGSVDLASVLACASDVWTWPSDGLVTSAAILDAARDLLVRDTVDGLSLCPSWSWGHAGVEVHHAPTSHGLLSFAVRWHGERAALLWDLEGDGVRLTAPALDPGWSSTSARGDALLGG